jgi:hypothetical protein
LKESNCAPRTTGREGDSFSLQGREALGRHWGIARPAVPGLVKAIEDSDLDVRKAAAEALKKIYPEAASKAGVK